MEFDPEAKVLNEHFTDILKKVVIDPLHTRIIETFEKIENKEVKQCPKCGQYKELKDFYDSTLSTGYGRICLSCKQYIPKKPKAFSGNSNKTQRTNCPKCKAPMVLRKSKYGEFWGCSKYPTCDGKRKI